MYIHQLAAASLLPQSTGWLLILMRSSVEQQSSAFIQTPPKPVFVYMLATRRNAGRYVGCLYFKSYKAKHIEYHHPALLASSCGRSSPLLSSSRDQITMLPQGSRPMRIPHERCWTHKLTGAYYDKYIIIVLRESQPPQELHWGPVFCPQTASDLPLQHSWSTTIISHYILYLSVHLYDNIGTVSHCVMLLCIGEVRHQLRVSDLGSHRVCHPHPPDAQITMMNRGTLKWYRVVVY